MAADLVTRLLLENKNFDNNLKSSGKSIESFNAKISKSSESVGKLSSMMQGPMLSSVNSFVGSLGAIAGISFALSDVVKTSMEFEKSLSSLKALTGLSANEMEYFKRKAIELGSTSTQTASQVVEAFQLIGSQQPELLKSKEALAEVTKQAIILAEASGMAVPEAAKALSGSINQMGEGANVAGEYINILAAASQAGSADIQYLSKAIEKSGGAASSVGVKYNELVAAIETIAPKITEASEAGTNLRNIFLTLESSSDKNLKPSVVGLSAVLDNLAEKNMNVTALTKMFGKESVTAALAIIKSKDEYKNYLEAITGTNTALEQQDENNNNLAGSLAKVSSAWTALTTSLNQSNGVMKRSSDFMTAILNRITELTKSEEQKQNEIIEKAVKERKEILSHEIDTWTDTLKDKKAAINEVMRQLYPENPESGADVSNLDEAKNKLEQMRKTLAKMNEEQKTSSVTDKLVNQITGLPNLSTSYGQVYEKSTLEENISKQQDLVNKLELKNRLYQESVQYLNDELETVGKINKNQPGGSTVDFEKLTEKQKEERKFKLDFSIEKTTDDIRSELVKKLGVERPIPMILRPEYVESEETPDITGSIADYQKQIQDVTVAYNEETNAILRGIYAKRIEDLQKTLEEMTDVNKGMIDISKELEDLVKNGIGVAFESLGEALSAEDAGEGMRMMLLGVMDMLKQFGSALVAAGAAKIAFDKLFANPYLAIVAGGALIIAATAAKSALSNTKGYTNGGIIPGSSYTGDNVLARVNSKEMVLNQYQQGNLFKLLNSGYDGGGNNKETPSVRFFIEGSDLVGVLNNFNKKQRRGR